MANVYGMDYNSSMDDAQLHPLSSPQPNSLSSPSSSSNQKPRRATEEQSLIPVTIKMILSQSNNMLPDGREPHNIKLVAAIRNVEKTSTAYNYSVEDGSGSIDVKEWIDESDPLKKTQMREEASGTGAGGPVHQYVRIIGKMQDYEGRPSIVAYSVRKVKSGNELTHHFLEVVYSSEKYKRASQIVGSPNQNNHNSMMMGEFNPGYNNMPSASTPIGIGMNNNNNNNNNSGKDGLHEDIKNFLSGAGNNGRDIREFINGGTRYTEKEILEAVTSLASDGIIYSTSDENHYAYF